MGVVFRARKVSLGREVAVKVLRDSWLASSVQVRRFRAEAANVAKLKHPNIVAVHDVGEQEGQHFFAMDLVKGENLAEATREGPLPPRRAAELVAKVAEAVQHAHQEGVLHRDLKPSNVLLDSQDEPHVTDFGLARPMDDESSLTLTGQVLGTPGYIAPEQAKGGGSVGPAADVYGLGALLFHLLAGRAPFVGASTAEILTQVLQQEPLSPRLLNPAVPVDLAAVCLKCLAKSPAHRYSSAGELARDARRFLEGQATLARPAGTLERAARWTKRRPGVAMSLAALLVVGLAGLAGILWQWRRAEAESLKFQVRSYVADMDLANRAVDEGDLGTAKGLLRRYWPEPHQADLRNWEWRYLANLSEGDPHHSLVAHSSVVLSICFLNDNTLITAATADWRTVLWDLKERRPSKTITNGGFGGSVVEVMAVAPRRNAMFHRPAWHGATNVTFVDLHDGTESKLLDAKGPVKWLDISLDQKVLAVASANRVDLWDLDRKAWVQSFETEVSAATQGLFSPDGTRFVVADDSGHIAFWNLAEHRKLGVLIISNAPDGPNFLRFSADGRWLVSPGGRWPTRIWNAKDRTFVAELRDSVFVEHAVFSTDGRWLATVGGDPSVRLWETSSWRKTRSLHGHTDSITSVDFSPDGRFLATGARNGEVKLWPLDELPTAPERASFPASVFMQLAGDGSGFGRILQLESSSGVASWTAEAWSVTPLQRIFTVALPGPPSSGSVLPGGRGLVLGGYDGSIRVVGPLVGEEIVVTNAHQGEVYLMDASLDGSTLATKGMNGLVLPEDRVRIWWLPSLEPIAELPHFYNVHGIKLSDDGKLLAGFTGPGDMGVWEIPSMKGPPMWRGIAALQRIKVCAFSPDNRWLAAATPDDGGAFLWDLATHRRRVLPRALTEYTSLSFSPDGSRLAAGSEGESKLFDTATGQTVLSFKPPGLKLAFARDGESLLAVHGEGALVFHAPALKKLQFDWLKERPSEEPPPYLGPEPDYARPDRP
jgi:WD40 repeat protein